MRYSAVRSGATCRRVRQPFPYIVLAIVFVSFVAVGFASDKNAKYLKKKPSSRIVCVIRDRQSTQTDLERINWLFAVLKSAKTSWRLSLAIELVQIDEQDHRSASEQPLNRPEESLAKFS